MSQADYIKDIAKFGLENNREELLRALNEYIEHSRKTRKVNFALQLQSLIKDSLKAESSSGLFKVGPQRYTAKRNDSLNDLVLEKVTSDYTLDDLIAPEKVKEELEYFIKEHKAIDLLKNYQLPVSNKLLFHGPSGCGKTLSSYILAGELDKMLMVVNLGSIVSSKLGETSKNLSNLFRNAAAEDCIIFFDEFDSLGKVRDYNQDHGEMKRVVNTILQLFDYLPQDTVVIAATNQLDMIDDALLRRFDLKVELGQPNKTQIRELIEKTLKKSPFKIKYKKDLNEIVNLSLGKSFYVIQKTLITAIKRSLFNMNEDNKNLFIDITLWKKLLKKEI
ncbi:AAA family ATPase [Tenacibaculum maritimum]|uniref:AAA family ATPase n=1 Tax=Tenacibaculum maritimum TaxID=107401 RepID=UPI0012E4592E|nr:ATP-binding protein [Tenacibaculum maritimum]CAA0212647.1 AAA family ATPase [Tenacibaculum maritimum]